jgi:hypothetical protein
MIFDLQSAFVFCFRAGPKSFVDGPKISSQRGGSGQLALHTAA